MTNQNEPPQQPPHLHPEDVAHAKRLREELHDNTVNTDDYINESSGGRNENAPRTNWKPDVDGSRIVTVVVIVIALVIAVFVLSMCVSSVTTTEGSERNPYDILQQKVDGAFGTNDGADYNTAPVPQPGIVPNQPLEQEPPQDPRDKAVQDMQQQQELQNQREEIKEQQREAVPSVLPETPPAPVPLGGGY